ncbi:hypothetical protein [Desulforhopalus singaporensis]|uniref:Uncharacterized protein n=1 Tax=Desulforhopalus singaporensis TaxID=91360 RepID=A0A1H0TEW2_9BACT|nr:hypothetical protein [Desulforhopalus singaporensis]SDP52557.1 hypothetical protein SAMN05660330_03051 [Desulforhopalus singaporensis]
MAKLKNAGRRKVVKQMVGGLTGLAAYQMLPVNWDKPIVEQIFLPAHAACSGVAEYFGTELPNGRTGGPEEGPATNDFHVVITGDMATVRFTTTYRDAIFQVNNVPLGCPGASVSVPPTTEGCWEPSEGQGPQTLQILSISQTEIVIKVTGSNPGSEWQVSVPPGTGSLALTGCD